MAWPWWGSTSSMTQADKSSASPRPPSAARHRARSTATHSAGLCWSMRAAAGPSSGDSAPRPGACASPPAWGGGRWGMAGGGRSGSELLEVRALLIATGAYDLPVAFAGWTLPGVMSAGGMQTLLKSQFLRAGKRFVLAGSHPLLLLVADALVQAGGEILELAIARTRPALQELLAGWRTAPGHWRLLAQSAKALRNLRRHRVPIRFGTLVLRADGNPAVEQVTLGSVDSAWQVQPGTERVLQADTLVIGYGLLAASELARQAGCAVHWRPAAGGWVVRHDAQMRTSVERVCVAGEPAGVGGAEVAFLQGQLAALGIAATLHGQEPSPTLARAMRQTARALGKARRWSDLVLRLFEPRLDPLAPPANHHTPLRPPPGPGPCARRRARSAGRGAGATWCCACSSLGSTRWHDWPATTRWSAAARRSRPGASANFLPTTRMSAT